MNKSELSILHRLSFVIYPMAFFLVNSSLLMAQEESGEVEEITYPTINGNSLVVNYDYNANRVQCDFSSL